MIANECSDEIARHSRPASRPSSPPRHGDRHQGPRGGPRVALVPDPGDHRDPRPASNLQDSCRHRPRLPAPLAHKFTHDHRRHTPQKVGRAGLVSLHEDRHESNAPKAVITGRARGHAPAVKRHPASGDPRIVYTTPDQGMTTLKSPRGLQAAFQTALSWSHGGTPLPLVPSRQFVLATSYRVSKPKHLIGVKPKINSLSSTVSSNGQNALPSQEHVKRTGKPNKDDQGWTRGVTRDGGAHRVLHMEAISKGAGREGVRRNIIARRPASRRKISLPRRDS